MSTAVKNNTRRTITIKVEPNDTFIPPRSRGDDHFSSTEQWDSWREFCDDLADRLQGWPHLPRPGDLIADPVDTIYCISVMHRPHEDEIVIFVGEQTKPVKEPTPAPQNGERRIPERIYGGPGGDGSTISVIEDMRLEARMMHSQLELVRQTLERDIEDDNFRCRHFEARDVVEYCAAELDVFRDRFKQIVDGYYGRDTA